ncbi:1-phosphofructokinase [uncultured Microbacterium sp.]|uniref:1-phosphofructokinase n=1 Tax=uncultured Microbacterium sp. TaxID=191216 RepID=UPI0035CAB3D2
MIVTVTANPSIDRAVRLDAPLEHGEVQRALDAREDAGGKGVNVARALRSAGVETIAVVPCGDEDPFRLLLEHEGVPAVRVPIAGRVRANLTVTDPDGTTTKINMPGPTITEAEASALIDAIATAADGAEWIVFAGSLPPGLGEDFYSVAIAAVRERWGERAPKIAVDTSGAALDRVVADGRPDLIKPNEIELAELVGEVLDATGDVVPVAARLARMIVPGQVGTALVTLGGDGALLVTADGVLRAHAPRITVASTVGAGDSSLAGYLIADVARADAPARLRRAVSYGAAAASLPGTQIPTPSDVPAWDVAVTPYLA